VASIRVEHPDGTEDILEHRADEVIRKFGKTGMARLFTLRRETTDVTLQEDIDEVYLVGDDGTNAFGGVLKDIERGGSEVELVVDSFERLAREAQPTPGGQRRDGVADDTLVQEAIDAVPQLTAGTIQQLEANLTFVFSHSSQAKKIRTVEEATPGEVQYNADKTVDYVDRLGQDKSDTITISPEAQNLDGDISVKQKGGGKKCTHLRMLGVGEGRHQVEVNVVPDTDTQSYQNKVTYTGHDWEPGDRRIWDSLSNKEVTKPSTLETEGLTQIAEINDEFVEVEATLKGVDVELGDTVHVSKPKENIDRALRIVEWTRIDDHEGLRYECVLSSRQKTRSSPGEKGRKDVERYNRAFEGSPVTLNTSGGRQPVDGEHDYEMDIYYPAEVEYEHRVKLQVKGLNYRAYSQGAASGGGKHTHSVTIPDHNHEYTFGLVPHSHGVPTTQERTVEAGEHDHTLSSVLADTDDAGAHRHTYDSGSNLTSEDGTHSHTIGDSSAGGATTEDGTHDHLYDTPDGSTNEVGTPQDQWSSDTTSDGGGTTETSSSTTPKHTHEPNPGIIDFQEHPSNCDVIINGQSVGVSLGDGSSTFEETVDIAGHLTPGQFNTIRVTSDSLGHLHCALDIDVYRQVLGDG